VHRLLTPLLRRVYVVFGVFSAAYCCLILFEHSSWHKERLYAKLCSGTREQRISAAFDLSYFDGEEQLLRACRVSSPTVRGLAMNSLWDLWARAAGHAAFRQVQAANLAIERKAYPEALRILTQLTQMQPDFPEAWNRRATVYWQMGRYEDSIADAQKAVALNPNHFGAWQGMVLCYIQLGDLAEACRCIRAALRVTPRDRALQHFLGHCEAVLQLLTPHRRVQYDTV